MKKATAPLIHLFFFLSSLFPVASGSLLATAFGYRFRILSIPTFGIILGIIPVFAFFTDLFFKSPFYSSVTRIFSALLGPLAMLNAAICIFVEPNPWVVAGSLLSIGCGCYFTLRHGRPLSLKVTCGAFAAVMTIPLFYLTLICMIFGNIGEETVVKTLPSPTGAHYAQVVSIDQGALGGSTVVEVYESSKSITLFPLKLEKSPQEVYYGKWYEYETLTLSWDDDTSLRINQGIYKIK